MAFSILTFNCFGGLTPAVFRRIAALGSQLEQSDYQLVLLQEVQLHRHRRTILAACPSFIAHADAPYLHCPRGGLLTLSRSPIDSSRFAEYDVQGRPYTPHLMDVLLNKGILLTHSTIGARSVWCVNTHLMANYAGDYREHTRNARDQRAQLAQLAGVIRDLPQDALILVGGDFNIPRSSWLIAEFLSDSGLTDPLAGDLRPTYRPFGAIPARFALPIDFALYRAPASLRLTVSADLALAEPLRLGGGQPTYLSDHIGVRLDVDAGHTITIFPEL